MKLDTRSHPFSPVLTRPRATVTPVPPRSPYKGSGRAERVSDQQNAIRRLERAALDGHQHGQSWQAYFAAHAGTITAIISSDPAGWGGLRDRLLHLLTTGDSSGRLAAGDQDVDQLQVVPVVRPISDVGTSARLQPGIFSQVTR